MNPNPNFARIDKKQELQEVLKFSIDIFWNEAFINEGDIYFFELLKKKIYIYRSFQNFQFEKLQKPKNVVLHFCHTIFKFSIAYNKQFK